MKWVIVLIGLIGLGFIGKVFYKNTQQIDLDKKELVHVKPGQKDFQFNLNNILSNYQGEEKVKFLMDMGHDLLIEERQLYFNALVLNLKQDKIETNLLLIQRIKSLKIKPDEATLLAKNSCHFLKDNKFSNDIIKAYSDLKIDLPTVCH